jgi:hypothetical protein
MRDIVTVRNHSAEHATDSVTIVGNKRAGYGWRILDKNGSPVQVRTGKFLSLDVDSPEGRSAYEASLKAVNIALKLAAERAKTPKKAVRAGLVKRRKRLPGLKRRKGSGTADVTTG